MKKIIEVKNLSKKFKVPIKKQGFWNGLKNFFHQEYREIVAVDNISLVVGEWEKIAFLGPNGAGKSTTIKMLTWILYYTSGEIEVCGLDPSKDRKKLVYNIWAIFGQTSRLWYHLTAIDTFKIMAMMFDVPKEIFEKRINSLVDRFDAREIINTPIRKLSLWQRIKCEVITSLINSPKILFLDEPTIWLDIIAKQNLRDTINEINKTENTTIFLTSHDLWDVEKICDRIVIINYGKILFDGSLVQFKKDYIKHKIFKIKFTQNTEFKKLDFMETIKEEDDYIEFKIPNSKEYSQKTFELLNSKYDIEDIIIENPNIEDVIKQFYKKR
mgnify:CR=1 FL=1